MPAKIYYDSDREYHKKVARDYYQNNKESILEHKKNIYNNLSKEEKKEKAVYVKNWYNWYFFYLKIKKNKKSTSKNRYHNLPEDKMLELKAYQKDYQKKYREMKKAEGNLAKNAVATP